MKYPTTPEVQAASHEQPCRWHRFLNSPGMTVIDREDMTDAEKGDVIRAELDVMNLIHHRLFAELGGFTSQISKRIGWTE